MNSDILHHIQQEELDILLEVDRVCRENNIHYFLDSGSLIGAVRHHGFIPWDDDIDIGMLRKDYEYFSKIAPQMLSNNYKWQNWKNDPNYALPFGKVRKKHTLYVEEKGNAVHSQGFYIDVFPYDSAPNDLKVRHRLISKLVFWERCMLMKHNYMPWKNEGRTNLLKMIAFFPYKIISFFFSHNYMVNRYESLALSVPISEYVYYQLGTKDAYFCLKEWLETTEDILFEGIQLPIPVGTDGRLTVEYGDYMKLPPEELRLNRHNALKVIFSNGETFENI